jgi:hypothetical protein
MPLAKKTVVLILSVALLGATALRPKAVYALSDWEWAGIGVASYAVLVITLTAIVFGGRSAPLTAEDGRPPLREDQDPGTLRLGTDCNSTDGNVPIACW